MTEVYNPWQICWEAGQKAQEAYFAHILQSAAPEVAWLQENTLPVPTEYSDISGDDLLHLLIEESYYRDKLRDGLSQSDDRTAAIQQELDDRQKESLV